MIGKVFSGQSPKTRITIGLVSILVCVSIGASFLGLFPDRYGAVLAGRAAIAETVAVNSSVFITLSDIRRMEANLQILVSRNEEILSAAVKPKTGKPAAIVGDHASKWEPLEEGLSTESQLVVPIWEGEEQWGHIELRFTPLRHQGFFSFFFEPLAQFILFVSLFCFLFFKFYLGRMLKQLDPSQAIPDRVRSALDTMAEGLLVLDAKQNIVLANEAFSVLVGKEPDKLLGLNIESFPWQNVVAQDAALVTPAQKDFPWANALASSSLHMNHMLRLQLNSSQSYTFMVNCSPVLGPNGKAVGVMVSFDDITELEEKEIELRRSKEEAEAANRAKSDFLANMSHEIRTPMNAILGFTEVLMRGYSSDPKDSHKYLSTIASSGKHLLDLINDILDLSKVEAGRVEVETLPSPAHQVIQEVVKIMGIKAKEKGIDIAFHAEGSMPEFVLTDPARLRQILTNLVGNAIKFTEQGEVKVCSHYQEGLPVPKLVIEVSDTGIGMTSEQAAAVFNPFVQADSSITRRFGGTGLGLTISKRFAEALDGDIRVRSEQGKGSTFVVEIAAEAAPGARLLNAQELMAEADVGGSDEQQEWAFDSARILVVDDGEENRDLLKVVLSDAGLSVDTASNGKQGVDKVLDKVFDLVLMDVQMPEMDGYTAVKLMREQGINVPIIALTAHAMKGAESECLAAGYSGYMTKPIDIDKLLQVLAKELDATPAVSSTSPFKEGASPSPEGTDSKDSIVERTELVPIRSKLSGDSSKYKGLIERFVDRLEEQFVAIEAAASSENFEALADLVHWLKGSAGSLGFHDFTEPAECLEQFAKAKDRAGVASKVYEIKTLIQRIEVDGDAQPKPQELKGPTNLRELTDTSPVTSTLLQSNPKLRPMGVKFASRLAEKTKLMTKALEQGAFEELADLAHWLKGSAGTIGFHDFTDPAIDLEEAAQGGNGDLSTSCLRRILDLESRIEFPASQSSFDAAKAP